MTEEQIREILSKVSPRHILHRSPESYVNGFVSALLRVHPVTLISKILQDKFFIPDEEAYSDEAYYEYAAELSVANHLKLKSVDAFELDKNVNPTNGTDVDCFFKVGATKISLEIKSAREAPNPDGPGHLTFKTAGRVPNFLSSFQDLKSQIEGNRPDVTLSLGKNKDLTHRTNLVDAHKKFDPNSGVDHFNILFLAKGYFHNINEWYMHLYANEGLFTCNPFHPAADFQNVDIVMLSNLKYIHEHAREYHDWTLKDAFLLPLVNPHARSSLTSDSVKNGLSVFDHHQKEFNAFTPSAGDGVPDYVSETVKVNDYVAYHLEESQRNRYFPVRI